MCGLPGAGKTTLGKRLESELPAVRLCPDEWMAHLGLDFGDGVSRDRLEIQFWHRAQNLLQLGVSVILESGHWLRADRDEKRVGARQLGVAVELRHLDVPFEELVRRLEVRNAEGTWGAVPIQRHQLEHWAQFFETPDQAELALFDPPARSG